MPNNKSVGIAYSDPALTSGTTIDGAVITSSTIGSSNTITAAVTGALNGTLGATTPAAASVTSLVNSGSIVLGAVETVAGAGTDNTNAAAIAATSAIVVLTGANGTVGAILPASVVGKTLLIKNNGAAVFKLYPPASSAINGLTATTGSLNLASNTSLVIACTSATQWYSIPLLPS